MDRGLMMSKIQFEHTQIEAAIIVINSFERMRSIKKLFDEKTFKADIIIALFKKELDRVEGAIEWANFFVTGREDVKALWAESLRDQKEVYKTMQKNKY